MAINSWEDIFNNAPCGLHSIDTDGIYIEINDTELKWLGYSREEIIGKLRFLDIVNERSKQRFEELFPSFKENGFIRDEEFEMVCKDGTILPVLINSNANYDAHNNFINTTAYVVNRTEAKFIEESLAVKPAV